MSALYRKSAATVGFDGFLAWVQSVSFCISLRLFPSFVIYSFSG